jgi:hypothetical protein
MKRALMALPGRARGSDSMSRIPLNEVLPVELAAYTAPKWPECTAARARIESARIRAQEEFFETLALKDDKYLLVVQYIRPFRSSMCGALKWQQFQQRATGNNDGIDRSPRDR